MKRIILASTSKRRHDLFTQIGLPFETIISNYIEDMSLNLDAKDLCMTLAKGKAEDVALQINNGIVIGIDTFVVCNNKKLGKPKDEKTAFEMLKFISGKRIEVYSGICIIDVDNQKTIIDCEVSIVNIQKLSDEVINIYIKTGEPFDKAGAFAIQGMGGIFIESIHGCNTNVIGVPINNLYRNLKKIGIDITAYWKK